VINASDLYFSVRSPYCTVLYCTVYCVQYTVLGLGAVGAIEGDGDGGPWGWAWGGAAGAHGRELMAQEHAGIPHPQIRTGTAATPYYTV
jgi:hypothetical protein